MEFLSYFEGKHYNRSYRTWLYWHIPVDPNVRSAGWCLGYICLLQSILYPFLAFEICIVGYQKAVSMVSLTVNNYQFVSQSMCGISMCNWNSLACKMLSQFHGWLFSSKISLSLGHNELIIFLVSGLGSRSWRCLAVPLTTLRHSTSHRSHLQTNHGCNEFSHRGPGRLSVWVHHTACIDSVLLGPDRSAPGEVPPFLLCQKFIHQHMEAWTKWLTGCRWYFLYFDWN